MKTKKEPRFCCAPSLPSAQRRLIVLLPSAQSLAFVLIAARDREIEERRRRSFSVCLQNHSPDDELLCMCCCCRSTELFQKDKVILQPRLFIFCPFEILHQSFSLLQHHHLDCSPVAPSVFSIHGKSYGSRHNAYFSIGIELKL